MRGMFPWYTATQNNISLDTSPNLCLKALITSYLQAILLLKIQIITPVAYQTCVFDLL